MASKPSAHEALAESLSLLEEGRVSLEDCLAQYPEHADELRPLLEIALTLGRLTRQTSSPAAFATGLERMLEASAEEEHRHTALPNLIQRRAGWVAALFRGRRELPARSRTLVLRLAYMAAVVMILLAGGLFVHSRLRTTVPRAAELAQVNGVVKVLAAGSETWRSVSEDEPLEEGDRIRTGASSSASLVLFDGSVIELAGETEVAVTQMRSHRDGSGRVIVLSQWVGEMRNRVQPSSGVPSRFEVETPLAIAAVSGTEFTTAVENDGTTHVTVDEGMVNVTAQDVTITLKRGQETTVRPGHPPGPVLNVPTASPVLETTVEPTPTPRSTPTPTPTLPTSPTATPQPPAPAPSPTTVLPPTSTPLPPSPAPTPAPPTPTPTPPWEEPPPPLP
ncbi:MAG: FecR family protein [Anaerolineae bacterium]